MASFAEVLAVLGLAAALGGYFLLKQKKARYQAAGLGLFLAFVGAAFGGLAWAGVPGLLAAGPAVGPPKAGGVWLVQILDTSDTDRAEASELISPDGHSVTYIMGDADIDDVGDVDLNLRIVNQNTGLTTDIWYGEISVVSVGTVLVSGVPTPIANYTADLSRFAITYTEDAGDGDVIQQAAKATFTATTGDLEDISLDMDVSDAVLDDMAAGQETSLVYNVGGITITVIMVDSGAVT